LKFNDLEKDYLFYQPELLNEVTKTLCSGQFFFGEQTKKFEKSFAEYIGRKHCITVKNATDALMLCIQISLKKNPNATVIVPNFTAMPTAVAIKKYTNNIHYVDVDRSMTIDINKLPDIQNGIVLPVNLFGNRANMIDIYSYCKQNNHILIEDCAQSTGSGCGFLSDFACYSFYPTKPLNSNGDSSAILTDSDEDNELLRKLRFYGQTGGMVTEEGGINSRIDETQATILNIKLKKFEKLNNKRRKIARHYNNIIKGIDGRRGGVYHQYVTLWNNRDFIIEQLNKSEIPYMIHYSYHVSELPALQGKYNDVGYRVNDKILSLPVHPFLEENDIQKIEEFLHEYRKYEYLE